MKIKCYVCNQKTDSIGSYIMNEKNVCDKCHKLATPIATKEIIFKHKSKTEYLITRGSNLLGSLVYNGEYWQDKIELPTETNEDLIIYSFMNNLNTKKIIRDTRRQYTCENCGKNTYVLWFAQCKKSQKRIDICDNCLRLNHDEFELAQLDKIKQKQNAK